MTNEQERAEFEAWALAKWPGAILSPDQNNCGIVIPERYKHPKLQAAWEAYQAGRAAMQSQVESAKYKPISVEERLPERSEKWSIWSEEVIAYTKDGNQLMAFYDHESKEWEDVESIKLDDVTHWLPIPRLP